MKVDRMNLVGFSAIFQQRDNFCDFWFDRLDA